MIDWIYICAPSPEKRHQDALKAAYKRGRAEALEEAAKYFDDGDNPIVAKAIRALKETKETKGAVYTRYLSRGHDHGSAAHQADQWEKRQRQDRWRYCPSTHCERRQECANPHECCASMKALKETKETKVVQIVAEPDSTCSALIYALRDDGTIWKMVYDAEKSEYIWKQMPEPPK